jgi:predicted hydrocarbon binding protein
MVWERVLGEPVDVRVLESAVSGSDECMFEIRRRHVE